MLSYPYGSKMGSLAGGSKVVEVEVHPYGSKIGSLAGGSKVVEVEVVLRGL